MQTRKPSALRRACLPLASLSAVATLAAQPPASASAQDQETVQLTEFTVRAEPSDSYTASETITGSRVAEKIKLLPYTVNVLTSEFIEDFGFFDFGDDFAYTSSFGGYDPGGGGANVRAAPSSATRSRRISRKCSTTITSSATAGSSNRLARR